MADYSASDLKAGTKATFPTYTDDSAANYGQLNRLHAADPAGGYNHLLAELLATQDFMLDWGSKVANPRHYGAKFNGIDDDTAAIQAALAAPEKQLVYLPPGHVAKVTQKLYVPMRKALVSNVGFRSSFGGLTASGIIGNRELSMGCLIFPGNHTGACVQIGAGAGVMGIHVDAGNGSLGNLPNGAIAYLFQVDPALDPLAQTGGAGYYNDDGFFVHNWAKVASYGLVFRMLVQGWVFAFNALDVAYYNCLFCDIANSGFLSNVQFIGNRFFRGGPGGAVQADELSPLHANVRLEKATACSFTGNIYDYNAYGPGLYLKSCEEVGFANEIIHGCHRGVVVDGSGTYAYGNGSIDFDGFIGATAKEKILIGNAKNFFGRVRIGKQWDYGLVEENVPCIRTRGTCEKIIFDRAFLRSTTKTTGIEWSADTTKSGVELLVSSGDIATPVSDLNGGNFTGRSII
jgi:hypothetical protein